tara:strand:- start:1078 stop:1281 length:204 start_codon:yes stop_codon:yes gene_type:complete
MDEIITYILAGFVGIIGLWGTLKGIAVLTPTDKDDEFVAKAEPFVDSAIDLAERASNRDLDGDGEVG